MFKMKFTVAGIFLALLVSVNAYAVIEVAKVASPVGSHGPALINLHWPNAWPGSYWGKGSGGWGGWGGSSGYGGSSGTSGSGEGYGSGGGGKGNGGDSGYGGGYGGNGGDSGYGGGYGGNGINSWGQGGSVGYTGDAGYHDGKYVAINRGSIHVAPLVGHRQSVKSQNYQPAPGTTW